MAVIRVTLCSALLVLCAVSADRGGHHRHWCRLYQTLASTARQRRHPLRPFLAWKVSRLTELCSRTAAADYCDCRPAWQCPHLSAAFCPRLCRLHGGSGCCCPPGGRTATTTVSPVTTTTTTTSSSTSRSTTTTTTTSGPEVCRPLVLCPAAVADPASAVTCQLSDGSLGAVCSAAPALLAASAGQADTRPFAGSRLITESFVSVPGGDALLAERDAERAIEEQNSLGAQLDAPPRNSTVGIFHLNFRSSREEQELGLRGLRNLMAINSLRQQAEGYSQGHSNASPSAFSADASRPSAQPMQVPGCVSEAPIVCEHSMYRRINGECNNLDRPRQGRAMTGFKRLLGSTYNDGLDDPRSTSVTGRPLPSARLISERVVETISRELSGFTLSVMQWGQFIDHDFNHALIFTRPDLTPIECCEDGGRTLPDPPRHPQCIPIEIPADDPFYSRFGQRCMDLVRSLPAPDPECIGRPATPVNELTAYLDASNVYGSNMATLKQLRSFQDGMLLTSGNHLLPTTARFQRNSAYDSRQTEAEDDCMDEAEVCFRGGDTRVNEQSGLAMMHTIFLREHNRVAGALKLVHSSWDDERLFQEARRVVIAEWQHIIYNEWLPIIVGFDYARDHRLLPLTSGFSTVYNSTEDATISNEFATAAFRFGHSLLRDVYDLINANGVTTGSVNLTRTFFNPTVVADSFVEHARTLVERRPETFDANVISSVHEHLFTSNFRFGLDLIALNIQRGRDHGIPTYASMLEACSGVTLTSWNDLNNLMDSRAVKELRAVYDDPRDVDLFIGGLSELRARGAQVGPTFQCIIGQQFFELRYGDRFFYDNGGFAHSFTDAQLAEIRKSSWARIMCDALGPKFNGDFTQVQPLAFVEPTVGPNFAVLCGSHAIPKVNLRIF